MKLERILPFARSLLERVVLPGDTVIDATLGNGHDTAFLANLVGADGRVFGFDIQEDAITSSREKLRGVNLLDRVTLFHAGHEKVSELTPESVHGSVRAAIFNLGYLPGGDKGIVTKPETTISAIEQLLQLLAVEGIIILVVYHGHDEGAFERDELLRYVTSLDQKRVHVLRYQFMNQRNNAPFIIALEKR